MNLKDFFQSFLVIYNMKNISIYIHIPFCIKKCGYCDFVSFENHEKYFDEYTNTLINQIAQFDKKSDYIVDTIFLGGGTPSYLYANLTEKIFNAIYKNYNISEECEITTELNPKTISIEKANIYKSLGINRISIGLQAKQDILLKTLGRVHCLNDFINSYEIIEKAGFSNINVDIMTALPYQTENNLYETLDFVVGLNPTHISTYSLIIEENTPFYSLYSNNKNIFPSEEIDRKMYHNTVSFLNKKGYLQYEISNFSKKGYECRHNKKYWECKEYLGFGLNASGYINNTRYTITSDLYDYLKNPNSFEKEYIDKKTAMGEFMFLGLRMNKGISKNTFKEKFKISIFEAYPNIIEKFVTAGFMKNEKDRILLTPKGFDISNSIFCEFV